jgi:hypothetical protein
MAQQRSSLFFELAADEVAEGAERGAEVGFFEVFVHLGLA